MLIPEDFAQVNLFFGGNALPLGAQVTFGVALGTLATTPAYVAERAYDNYSTYVLTYHSSSATLLGARAKFGPNEDGPFAEFSGSDVGDGTGEALPPGVSIMVEKTTNVGGRRGRGRMYLPGFPEGAVDMGGVVDPGNVSGLNTALDDFLSAMATEDVALVLLHSTAPSTPYGITALTVDVQSATQRRRNRR